MNTSGLIIIEGNIGAGKSTFAKALAAELGGEYIAEPDEKTNPYLADYYKDPKRWAFDIQMFLLTRRYRAQKYAQARVRHQGGFVVMDRSYYGDVCFANVQKQLGYFSERDYNTYMAHHTDMKVNLEPPACAVFLDVPPTTCIERIAKRMTEKTGRVCEAGIEIDYLERLGAEISKLERSLRGKTLTFSYPWEQERTPEDIKEASKNVAVALTSIRDTVYDFWTGTEGIGV